MCNFILFLSGGIPSITAYEQNGLKIQFSFEKQAGNPNNVVMVTATSSNSSGSPMSDYLFQAAVPKVRITFIANSKGITM